MFFRLVHNFLFMVRTTSTLRVAATHKDEDPRGETSNLRPSQLAKLSRFYSAVYNFDTKITRYQNKMNKYRQTSSHKCSINWTVSRRPAVPRSPLAVPLSSRRQPTPYSANGSVKYRYRCNVIKVYLITGFSVEIVRTRN